MVDNLFDFGKEELVDEEEVKQAEENLKDKVDLNATKEIFDKYKNLNKDELMSELFRVVNNGKKNGTLNNQKINNAINSITPYLNENQKQFLDSIINKINE